MTTFVNPYNFVPLPDRVLREKPPGHHVQDPRRWSGRIDYDLTAITSVSVGDEAVLRGSHVHGALRTLHEALTGSCLRVFDDKFEPVYRELVSRAGRRQLGFYVAPTERNEHGAIRRVAKTVKIDHRSLRPRRIPGPPARQVRTLALVDVDVTTAGTSAAPHPKIDYPEQVSLGDGRWVLLVSDTRAKYREGKPTYWLAALPADDTLRITARAAADFCDAVAGADDLRPSALDGVDTMSVAGRTMVGVTIPPRDGAANPRVVGYRLKVEKELFDGQPVWYEAERAGDEDVVTWLGVSQVWRGRGARQAGERAPGMQPCDEWTALCPSCMTFGSADVAGRGRDERAVQESYRGHVRVMDPGAKVAYMPETETLSIAGSPRPGAGQFYLEGEDIWDRAQLGNPRDTPPKREWGSSLDTRRPRRIRGRKLYWTTSASRNVGPGVEEKQVTLIPSGTVFDGRVLFENLDRLQLGALLATLDPRLWLTAWCAEGTRVPSDVRPDQARLRIGGFKPHGLGAAKVTVHRVHPEGKSRWLGASGGEEPVSLDPQTIVDEWVADIVARRPGVVKTWPALAHLIAEDFLAADTIKYPPPRGDDVFAFWKSSQGFIDEGNYSPFRVLPVAEAPADRQSLTVDPS